MKTLTRITALTGAALLFALAGQAGAADEELTVDQVKAKIEAAGFTNVSDIRREEDHFDAKATKDGKKVILEVDAKTGTITTEYE
jgi:cytochrome c556